MVKVDPIGPWSLKKLNMLQEYLTAYSSILNNERKKWLKAYYYIDAFAGSVNPLDIEAQEYVEGSPLRALNVKPDFDGFVFIENNSKRVSGKIVPLREKYPDRKIDIVKGDCNVVLTEDVAHRYNARDERAFVFLDPYGLELDWKTVKILGDAGIFDVFINFSVMGVVRQLEQCGPKSVGLERINRVMGTGDWFSEVYVEDQQLFLVDTGKRHVINKEQLVTRVIEFYRKQLKKCFKEVSRSIVMRNSKNGPMYALILASQKPQAVERMHGIFKKLEKNKDGKGGGLEYPLFQA